jgi:hypothetical protein
LTEAFEGVFVSSPSQGEGDSSLYQTILSDTNLYRYLLKLDEDLAAEARRQGCACGGKLHSARYPRKPRGAPEELDEDYSRRHSFCCAEEGCRKRTTPPSFRFLARRVYVSVVVTLLTALRHGATPERAAKLRQTVGVSARTLERWRRWWQEEFPRSAFWKWARGRLRRPVEETRLPMSLLECFEEASPQETTIHLLGFILPLTNPLDDSRKLRFAVFPQKTPVDCGGEG